MRNKILAAALLSAFSCAASAQSANVTLYGTLLGDFQGASATGADTSTAGNITTAGSSARNAGSYTTNPANQGARSRMNSSSSAFGIRGTEDLGGGTQAWFQLELSATLGNPSGSAGGANHGNAPQYRNSAVGLRSATWGSVSVGTWDTPFNVAGGSTMNANTRISNANTNLLAGTFGSLSTIGAGGSWSAQNESAACAAITGNSANGCFNAGTNFDRRQKALLQYWTPNWSGFEARVAYAAVQFSDAQTADNRGAGSLKPSIWDLSATYTNGPLAVGYAFSRQNDLLAYTAASASAGVGAIGNGIGTGAWQITGANATGSRGTGHRIGGKYAFDLGGGSSIGIGAMWETLKWTVDYNAFTAGDLTELKKKAWRVQGNYSIGNHFFAVEYNRANALEGSIASTGGATAAAGLRSFDGSGTESKVWLLAYNYAFSKRTSATLYYVFVNNGVNSVSNAINSTGIATAAGADPKYLGVNLRHTF